MHETVEDVIAEGIADRLMPLFSGKLRAVFRSRAAGTERSEVLNDRKTRWLLYLSVSDWYLFEDDSREMYREESVELARRFLEEGCWQAGPVCKIKKKIYPSLFFALPNTPRAFVYRPLAVCTKDSVQKLAGFVSGLRDGVPLREAGLIRDLQDEPSLIPGWERLAETCPLNTFEAIEDEMERGRKIREWLAEQGVTKCRSI